VTRRPQGGRAGVPFLSLHGESDEIVPIELGRKLFDALPAPAKRKRWASFPQTGHNDVPYSDPARYLRTVAQFLVEEHVEEHEDGRPSA
jgi:fermentation-respiration switch protein FrsA (DUF1100 family)